MLKPQFKITRQKHTSDYGKFILEPLEKGYGDTLGNSLRRCLLTSIAGAAVTSVKFSSARHQFSTIDGVQEDIVQIILNIKKLRIKYSGEGTATIKLEAKTVGPALAEAIKTPADVEIVNSDLVLAHLTDKKAKLSIEMTVGTGFGFSMAEERKTDTIGVIPVDAAFSPVRRINYKVESTRVGRRTDFDRLIMEIWTDGTLAPKSALEKGAQILVDYFQQIYSPTFDKAEKIEPAQDNESLSLTVEELDLPTRIVNALIRGGYKTVKDLTGAKKEAVSNVKNLGGKSVDIVEEKLKEKGLSFK